MWQSFLKILLGDSYIPPFAIPNNTSIGDSIVSLSEPTSTELEEFRKYKQKRMEALEASRVYALQESIIVKQLGLRRHDWDYNTRERNFALHFIQTLTTEQLEQLATSLDVYFERSVL